MKESADEGSDWKGGKCPSLITPRSPSAIVPIILLSLIVLCFVVSRFLLSLSLGKTCGEGRELQSGIFLCAIKEKTKTQRKK